MWSDHTNHDGFVCAHPDCNAAAPRLRCGHRGILEGIRKGDRGRAAELVEAGASKR